MRTISAKRPWGVTKKVGNMIGMPESFLHPFHIACCGYSNSGKTTLISRLVAHLGERYTIGYSKHCSHSFDIDRQGKDSQKVRESGAAVVVLSAPEQNALLSSSLPEPLLVQPPLLHVDFLLIEGLKELPIPKLVVIDKESRILEEIEKKTVTNVAALIAPEPDTLSTSFGVPVFQRDNIPGIAEFIIGYFTDKVKRSRVFGLVLAGGKSTRMWEDKATLAYYARNQIIHTASLLQECCARVYVSCRTEQQVTYREYGFPLIMDSYSGIGPLGGLLSAQQHFPDVSWLVAACDLPFIDRAMMEELIQERHPFSFATAFRRKDAESPEPLLALYEPKCRIPLLLRHAVGKNSLKAFLATYPTHRIITQEAHKLRNINDPAEKAQAERELREKAGARK